MAACSVSVLDTTGVCFHSAGLLLRESCPDAALIWFSYDYPRSNDEHKDYFYALERSIATNWQGSNHAKHAKKALICSSWLDRTGKAADKLGTASQQFEIKSKYDGPSLVTGYEIGM